MLKDGYVDVPDGRLAATVTFLEMKERPRSDDVAPPSGISIRRVDRPTPGWYRDLFRRVGEPWLWTSRLRLTDEELLAILHHPATDVFALHAGEEAKGLLELDRSRFPEIELAFFGVTKDLIGRGTGRFLMHHAIKEAWAHSPSRFWVHTCTHDSPQALGFYIRAGFVPYRRAIEVMPDPRLSGIYPLTTAPQVPIIKESTR